MRAELGLPSVRGDDEKGGGMMGGFGGSMGGVGGGKAKRPINVKFEIPYFTTSGIQVRYLKIIEPKVSTKRTRHFEMATNGCPATISIFTVGTLHYTVGRHRSTVAGCKLAGLNSLIDEEVNLKYTRHALDTNMCYHDPPEPMNSIQDYSLALTIAFAPHCNHSAMSKKHNTRF